MLITFAPWSTANLIPAETVGPELPARFTTTGRIRAPGATPTIPVPRPWPAINTAIAVPWPSVCVSASVRPSPVPPATSPPGSTTPARSGTLACAPVSSTATVTPPPRDRGHTFCWIFQVANHHSPGRGCGPGAAAAVPGANATNAVNTAVNTTAAPRLSRSGRRQGSIIPRIATMTRLGMGWMSADHRRGHVALARAPEILVFGQPGLALPFLLALATAGAAHH